MVQQVLRQTDPIGHIACHVLLGGLPLLGFVIYAACLPDCTL